PSFQRSPPSATRPSCARRADRPGPDRNHRADGGGSGPTGAGSQANLGRRRPRAAGSHAMPSSRLSSRSNPGRFRPPGAALAAMLSAALLLAACGGGEGGTSGDGGAATGSPELSGAPSASGTSASPAGTAAPPPAGSGGSGG